MSYVAPDTRTARVDFSHLDQVDVARAHGVCSRTIRRWCALAGMPRNDDGTFDLPHTIRWRAENSSDRGGWMYLDR